MSERISSHTEVDGSDEEYHDVYVDGNAVASVKVDDDEVKVDVVNPNYPEESVELYFFPYEEE